MNFPALFPRSLSRAAWVFALLLALASQPAGGADTRQVGDLNADGVLSVVDLTLLRLHVRNIQKLEDRALVYADVNGDGVVNEDDAAALIRLITATDTPRVLPLTGIRETSPQNGESGVVSNRRTGIVVRFSLPLGANDLTQDNFYASVNGAKLKSRAAFSADHKTAALFVEDKIPGDARVDVTLKTDGLKDLLGRVIDGDGDGEPGGDYTFSYKTEPLVVAPNTKVIGTVYASEKVNGADKPLAGVIVRVAGTEDVQTLTDADGKFSLDCPPGRFFAEVDGRKVAGTDFAGGGAYYPYVIKAWEAVAGSTENLAAGSGKIYLPLIPAGALQSVDTTKETKVELTPEAKAANKDLAEVSLTVPPNALRKEDGSVGGKIGMAAVDPARTPEPLAAGLKFPLVITIQTDGSPVFDQPLPLKFPNLADPVTGVILKPGEKSALWSFNHDSGSWEMQGPMTVTDDGKYIVSDPGIGVRQAGWHGVLPGSQGVGPRRPISSPVAVEGVKKDVQNALTIAAQSSLPLRDAFLRFGAMRGLAEDLQQIRSMVDELRPMVDDYNRSGTLPYVWSTYWIKLRIGKLKASYSKLLGAGEGSLLTDMALIKPNLTTLKAALQSLQSFNQSVYSDYKSFKYLATDFATANATLLQTLVLTQEYLDALNAGLPSLNKAAFDNAVKVLFPPIGAADPTQTQEMDALTRFLAELEPVAAVVSSDHANRFLTLEYQMSDYLARAGAFSTAENPTPKSGYIVVDALGEPQRIRSNGSGDYRMVLPPNKEFAVTYVDPKTLRMGSYVGISNWNGVVTDLYGPVLAPLAAGYVDTDGDKLADVVEYVIGTDPKLKDTDKDGVSDYAEVTKGKNPLSGLAVGIGLVYSMTSSREGFEAVDVDTGNDLLLVAESAPGGTPELQGALVVYNIDNKLEPARQSVLALEFPAYRVRYGDGGYGILSLHENGVAIADVSNPSNAYLKARYPAEEGYSVNSAILVGDVLVMGMNHLWQENESKIVFKDLATGQTTFEQKIGGVISDMVASGTVVHVLNKGSKSTQYWWWYWALTTAVYTGDVSLGSLAAFTPVTVREWEWSKSGGRLALSSDRLFAVYESGLTSLKLADPLKPSLEGDVFKPESGFQRGWRQVLFDGSRDSADLTTFVAALGSSASDNGDADGDVAVFQFGLAKNFGSSSDSWWQYWLDGTTPMARFITRFDARADKLSQPSQPSLASGRIFSIAMAGGIVYGADKEKGVKVFNYRKYDSSGIPPTIQLLSNSPSPSQLLAPRIESGSLLSLRALVKDDVALSSVDWFVNGTRVASNGGFPWGYTLRMPSLKTEEISRRFKVEARAFDTGGNQATTSEWSFDVVRDAIPPKLLSATPSGGKALVEEVSVSFSEAMAPASLAGALRLFSPGPDGLMGTADDLQITGGSLLASETSLSLAFTSQLPEGHYRAKLQGTVSDLAGNPLGDDHSWDFSIAAANTWIGPALGLWSDPANWSSGTVPVSGERVVFPREGAPRVIVGGRTTFTPTDASGNQLALVAGETKFSRLLTKNMPGGWWWWGNSNTPAPKGSVRAGMRVKGSKIADGTVVKSASITNDTSDPTSQKQTTMLELSNPLGEAVGDLPWVLSTALDLRSLQVDGETTLVDVDLEITEPIVLGAKLAFSGECNVSVESVRVAEAGSRLAIVAGVDTGTLVGGGSGTTSGLLRLNSGLKLTDNLGVEAVGIGGTTKLEVVSGLDLAGKQLDFFGGYGGAFKLTAGAGVKTFALTGPGKVAFKWQEALLADGSLEAGKLLTKVSVPQLNLPEGVEWDVAGLGKVQLNAADFANNGTIRVEPNGWLKATRYRLVGDNARELVADTGTFEKMPSRAGGKDMITASFKGSNLAIKEDGTLWAWGYNGSGQLGLGYSSEVVNVPTQVGTDSDWNAVTAPSGGNSAFALKADGTLWAWGYNGSGQLGLGYSSQVVNVPTRVGTDSDWISVSVGSWEGSSATYGLKSDGTLWAWGGNWNGEAGLGFSGAVTAPTRVGSDADWESVSVPQWGNGVFGLKTEGTLWAWGSNWNGELGLGSSDNTVATPTQVGTDSDWAKVVCFGSSSYGLKTDGTLWAWGYDGNGELGLGSSGKTVSTPTQIGADSDWVAVSYCLGLKADGTLWAWGYNWDGQLGLGYSGGPVTVPTQVGSDADWSSILRLGNTYGIKTDGTLWAWGYMGSYWDNGNYLENYLKEPTQVGTDADWNYLSAWYGVFGFKQDGSLWAWGYNGGGMLGTGRFEDYLTVPAKIESEVAWKLPSVVRINTNSPSPSNLRVPRIPSGSNLAVSATVLGKAQLGSIEWFLNGTRFASSKLAPWSANTLAPTLANDEQSRRVRIEAYVFDTRGDLLDIVRRDLDVVRDATPPVVLGTPTLVSSGSGTSLQVGFSEKLGGSLLPRFFKVLGAGADGLFGTGDDFEVPGGTSSFVDKTAIVSFESELSGGRYRLVLNRGLLDEAGNPLGDDYKWEFAASSTWVGPALGSWSDPTNWSGGGVPQGGARVLFPATSGPRVVVGDRSAPVSVESLQVSGETTLVNVVLNVAEEITLNADLAFSGENDLKAGRINAASTGRLVPVSGLYTTNSNANLAVAGSGFFIVKDPQTQKAFVTRYGNFHLDANGALVTEQGHRVQGAMNARTKVVYDSDTRTYNVLGAADNYQVIINARSNPTPVSGFENASAESTILFMSAAGSLSGLSTGMPISSPNLPAGTTIQEIHAETTPPSLVLSHGILSPIASTDSFAVGQKSLDAQSLTLTLPCDYRRPALTKGMRLSGAGIKLGTEIVSASGNLKVTVPASPSVVVQDPPEGITVFTEETEAQGPKLFVKTLDGISAGMIVADPEGPFNSLVVRSFGVDTVTGKPWIEVVNPDGTLLNGGVTLSSTTPSFVISGAKTLSRENPHVLIPPTFGVQVGDPVTGDGIPEGTLVKAISSDAVTGLSKIELEDVNGMTVYPDVDSNASVRLAFKEENIIISTRPLVDSFESVLLSLGDRYISASWLGDTRISFNEDSGLAQDPRIKPDYTFVGTDGRPLEGVALQAARAGAPQIRTFNIGVNGEINVILSNGQTFNAGNVLLWDFQNPGALVDEGNHLFSGMFEAGFLNGAFSRENIENLTPGSGGLGIVKGGALNVPETKLGTASARTAMYRLKVVAGVDAGWGPMGNAVLRMGEGLSLTTNLEVETTGVGGATVFEIGTRLALGGKSLRILGGYGGALKFTSGSNGATFALSGPGVIATDWQEALFAKESLNVEGLALKVSAPALNLPAGVTLDVAGLGKVEVMSPKFTNAGTVRVGNLGWLRIVNYGISGDSAVEDVATTAIFEKTTIEGGFKNARKVAVGELQSYAIKEDGTLWAWGDNRDWMGARTLGLGWGNDQGWVGTPSQVGSDNQWVSIASENYRTMALRADGTLWAWGQTVVPVQVGTDCDWAFIHGGMNGAFAIKTNGTLWDVFSVSAPEQVGDDSDWSEIFGNLGHFYGLKDDGTLWFWGYESGTDQVISPRSPKRMDGDGWSKVATSTLRLSGILYSFGIKKDGTLWAWGDNGDGRLGLGESSVSFVSDEAPLQVGEARDWLDVSTFMGLSFALKKDGSLWTWGRDDGEWSGRGVLGEGFVVPTQVDSEPEWVHLIEAVTCFGVKRNGSLWVWGFNELGVSGTGSSENPLNTPTRVDLNVNWPQRTVSAQINTNALTSLHLSTPRIQAGGTVSLSASVTSGAPAGTVDWYVNGMRVGQTSGDSFSYSLPQGMLRPYESKRRIQITARILDDAGNLIATSSKYVDVVRDATPPVVEGQPSITNGVFGTRVGVTFSKVMDATSLEESVRVFSAGLDGVLGTSDDNHVQGASLAFSQRTATLTFANGLGDGTYRVVVDGGLLDTVGNPLGSDYSASFTVTSPLAVVGATPAIHPPVPQGIDLTTGLVAYYPLNGDARDASGNGKDGTVLGAELSVNHYGQTGGFRFPSDEATITLPVGHGTLDGNFTVSFWMKASDFSTDGPIVLNGQNGFLSLFSAGAAYDPVGQQGHISFNQNEFPDDPNTRLIAPNFFSTQPIECKKWVQVVAKRSGLSLKLYINGREDSSAQGSRAPVTVGDYIQVWGTSRDSVIDTVRIYNRALTSAEVSALYAAEVSLPAVDPNGHVAVPIPGTNVAFSKYETTVGQWKAFVAETGWNKTPDWTVVSYQDTSYSLADNQPVVAISRDDANEYCAWLSRKTGKRWRLPSEEEWLKADQNFTYPWGDYFPPLATDGNFQFEQDGYTIAAPVGSFSPNALGLYDLAGNVWEWTTSSAPDGNAIIKGGNFELTTNEQEIVKNSYHLGQGGPHGGVGFRVVQDLSAKLVSVAFNRPIAQDRASNAVVLYSAGADGLLGTADDVRIEPASVSVSGTQLQLAFASDLADGLYRGVVAQGVTDVAGIGMLSDYTWEFAISSEARWVGPSAGAWDAPANWSQGRVPTAFDHVVLPLEGSPRVIQVNGVVGVRSLKVLGETTLMNAQVGVVEDLTLSENLRFSGECSLGARGVVATRSGARLCVSTPGVEAPAARLSLSRGLALLGDLEVESAGRSALTTLEIVGNLDLAGHTLQVFGGVQGSVRFVDSVDTGGFALNGPGKVAFDWQELLLEDPDLDWSELYLRVDANSLTLPQGVEWNVAGLGLVEVWASSFLNRGKVHVQESGWLKIYNYTRVGDAQENTGADAVFEKLNM